MKFGKQKVIRNHRRLTPFDIPEILEGILIHLSQTTLRFSTSLVCRQWHAVSKPLITYIATWRYDMQREDAATLKRELIKRLEGARSLEVFGVDVSYKHYENRNKMHMQQWRLIQDVLRDLNRADGTQIRTLTIHNVLRWEYELQPTLKRLPLLTSLVLVRTSLSTFPLLTILQLCPQLEHVNIFSDVGVHLGVEDPLEQTLTNDSHQHFPLKSITLQAMVVMEPALLAILARCPYLQQLHLINRAPLREFYSTEYLSTPLPRIVTLNNMRFFHHIAGLCPRINALHVSHPDHKPLLAIEKVMELWALFPFVTDWSFLGTDAPIVIPSILTCTPNVLTSLEIKTPITAPDWNPMFLHNFLCEASHLVRLKTSAIVPLEPLDLEGHLMPCGKYRRRGDPELLPNDPEYGNPDYVRKKNRPRKIWACQNLRTMDVVFGRKPRDSDSLENSRMIFSYLSKVCPDLEDLKVRYSQLRLEQEGGLCLLTRLHRLQRLVLVQSARPDLKGKELEWLTRRFSAAVRVKMYAVAIGIAADEPVHVEQLAPFRSLPAHPAQGGHGHEDLDYVVGGVDMRNMGRMADITDLIMERQTKKWICWPLMEEIDVLLAPQSGPVDPEKRAKMVALVRRFRPDIRFDCRLEPYY
ncbi:hypothetical protein CPB97_005083 [Podila verticillata]|nr:hypothetical protein CPB97_005083 [Podila verticillata]